VTGHGRNREFGNASAAALWAVVPAAGGGRRTGAATPKQYLEVAGKTLLQHVLCRLRAHPRIRGIVAVLAAAGAPPPEWSAGPGAPVRAVAGGAERCHSVLNGLRALADTADARDWALVHDAARPCLHPEDLERLIREGAGHPVGGVLAAPVQDTLKRAGPADEIAETVPREGLWQALTPQIFRLGRLTRALEETIRRGLAVSDEAQAMEIAYGDKPLLIRARHDNRKLTYPADLEWVRHALREPEKRQTREAR